MEASENTDSAIKAGMLAIMQGMQYTVDELTGAVTFEAAGASHSLLFSTSAMRKAEAAFDGVPFFSLVERIGHEQRVTDVVRLLAIGLGRDKPVTIEETDLIVDDIGYLGAVSIVTKAVELAAVKSKSQKAGGRPLAAA